MALRKPVIWTCRADDHAKLHEHFDTRQYPHVKWHEPSDLANVVAAKLRAIRAGVAQQ
jgi:hypothetical protein